MLLDSLLRGVRDLRSRRRGAAGGRRGPSRAQGRLLRCEPLENRVLLSVADCELSTLLAANGAGPGETDPSTILWHGEQRAVNPGHWIVAMDGLPATPALQLTAGAQVLQQRASGPALKALRSLGGQRSLLIESAPNVSYAEVKASLSGLPGFRYVEPDFIISLDATTPNDPSFPSLYGLNNTGQTGGTPDADIDAPEAWDLTIGSRSIVVGVIDTGVDYNHPDLAANIWTNPVEIAGDGIDNDGNGYVDDVHGWDFYNNDADPMDDNGHGTHVSGTIGAVGNNGVGVAGVNWQVQIMGLKFLGSGGSGPTSAAVSAVNYATTMRQLYSTSGGTRGANVVLTNNSWGGGAFSQALSDAIAASGNAGMLFVASAGNAASNNDAIPSYPASYNLPNIIAVAATDRNDALASFSNYGATSVDLAAPGVDILSTTPNNTYSSFSGTSMAAPHVSGVAALAWSYAPGATYQQIRDALFAGVDPVPALIGRTVTGGRLNARYTLAPDAGDTLATARGTHLLAPSAGAHYIVSSAKIGDGAFSNKDVDLYKLTGTPGSSFTAVTSQPSGGAAMDTVLRLFNSAGGQVAMNDNFNGGPYSRLDYTFTAAGTYYIGVSGAGNAGYNPNTGGSGTIGSTGDYRLDLSLDIGDTLGTALSTGLVLGGNFTQPNTPLGDGPFGTRDVDLYHFTAPARSSLRAITSQPPGEAAMDTVLRLFDSAGTQLAIDDNPDALYSHLDYTFTTAGAYYLGVSGDGNAGYNPNIGGSGVDGSTGNYRLDVSPTLWATYLGGSSTDQGRSVAIDTAGNTLVTGYTSSSDFEGVSGYNGGTYDAFVAKVTSTGTVAWVTYLGGTDADYGRCIAVDHEGNALVTGYTTSTDFAGVTRNHSDNDAFVAKVNGNDGSLTWATYLGGSSSDYGYGIAVDADGNALVTGTTTSQDFPNAGVFHGGANDAFVAKVNGNGGSLTWATYLGGSGDDQGQGIALDPDGNALVTGYTASTNFAGVIRNRNDSDAFVAKVRNDGTHSVDWAAYLGGSSSDYGYGIAVDSAGNALVTGNTTSTDFAGIRDHSDSDAFVAKVNSNTHSVDWAAYLGGSGYDYGYGIAVDTRTGNALVTGYTTSPDFAGAKNSLHGGSDAFVAEVNSSTHSVDWCSYLGGSGYDYGYGIAVGTDGYALVAGYTSSPDFAGANNLLHGGSDAFLLTLNPAFQGAPGIAVGPIGGLTTTESGGTATFQVRLSTQPTANVMIGLLSSDTTEGTVSPVSMTFTSTNWNTSQTVTVTGMDDAVQDGDVAYKINTGPVTSNDPNYNGLDPADVSVTNKDNDIPGVSVSPTSGLTTTEGGRAATFTMRLNTPPTADVTIALSSSDLTEGTVSPGSMTFTSTNWNTSQTVTVTGKDDNEYDGDVAYKINTGPVASIDPNYNEQLDPADVSLTNKDNDMAPAITFGGSGDDKATGVATDANGNVYVTGSFQNTVDFNPDPKAAYNLTVVGSSTSNDFVASYSPSGAFRWAHQIGGGTTPSIAVAAGYVFVSASFTGTVDFDPSPPGSHTLTSRGGNDEFLLKLDANTGNFTWVQQIGGSGSENAGGMALGPDGNLYLAGNTSSGTKMTFGGSLRPTGSGGLYITKVNPSTGQFVWATLTGTNSSVVPYSIAVDSTNSIYVAGDYNASQQFGSKSITLKPHGTSDAFLLKTDSTGKPLWADGFGAAGGSARANGVAVDAGGSVYLTGSFNTSLDSYSNTNLTGAKGVLTSAGGYDAFVLKVGSSGSLLAKQRMGGPCIPWSDWGAGIAVDSALGLVYVKGYFYLKADFGGQTLASSSGWWDAFVAKLKTADLSFVQTYHFGCSNDSGGANGVAVGATGVYVAGTYSYGATFPAGDYHTSAGSDAYVLKLDPAAAMISGRVFADANSNGQADDGLATPASCRVFLDADGDGLWDAGEISTYTYGEWGTYEFYGLDPGQYNVREVPAAGWTPTTPVSQVVALGAGQSAVVDFGNYFKTQTSTYASTSPPVAINSSGTTTMPITVHDSYRILDLNVTVNLAYGSLSDLTVTLISPNGMTRVTLAGGSELSGANLTGTIFDDDAAKPISQGTAPYTGSFRPNVPLEWVEYVYNSNIQGQWLLEVNNRTTAPGGSFLYSWSMTVVHQDTRTMGAMAVVNQSTRLTDAALASLMLYDPECPSKPARGKGLAMIPAIDLALLDLAS